MTGYNPVIDTPINSGTGDNAPTAFSKVNSMTQELFAHNMPLSVGAIGDSITQKNQLLFDLSINTAAQCYAKTDRTWQPQCWLLYGAMRSNNRWFAWDFNPGYSGGTTAQILSSVLPCFLGYPNGLPDACIVLGGTNDVTSVPTATSLSNLKSIYTTLIANNVCPVAMTIPPRSTSMPATLKLNLGIKQLAREMKIPFIDIYGSLLDPTNGQMLANLSIDGVHPTALGCGIMGYKVNQGIIEGFTLTRSRAMIDTYAAALGTGFANVDPNFLTYAGTINTTSSYPNSAPWGAPGTAAMCTMNSAPAGTEPGIANSFTMDQPVPFVMNYSSTPNYIGNSFSVAGDGTHGYQSNPHVGLLTYAVGDRIALAFRVKAIMAQGNTNPGTWVVVLLDNTLGTGLCGFFYGSTSSNLVTNGQASIGNESAYPAGDFYTEITVPAGAGGTGWLDVVFSTTTSGSNSGDSITIANLRAINLTALGIVSP